MNYSAVNTRTPEVKPGERVQAIHTGVLKNSEFDEEGKFHEAGKWSYIPEVRSQSEELFFLVNKMSRYINANRLDSVLLKTGRLNVEDAERLAQIKVGVFTGYPGRF